jgi:hypothetical protein
LAFEKKKSLQIVKHMSFDDQGNNLTLIGLPFVDFNEIQFEIGILRGNTRGIRMDNALAGGFDPIVIDIVWL